MNYSEILNEYRRNAETGTSSELLTFFKSLGNNTDDQAIIFNAIQLDDARTDIDSFSQLLKLLLSWYRSVNVTEKHLVVQYLPHLIAHRLVLGRSSRKNQISKKLDTFFMVVYNHEVADERGEGLQETFFVPSISYSSIYHDGGRVDPTGLDRVDRDSSGLKLSQTIFKQFNTINAQNRMIIMEALLRSYTSIMGELPKSSLEQFVKTTQILLQRGYSGPQNHRRVNLPSPILLELLNAAYFCIYNGQQSGGTKIVDLIRQRGAAMGSTSVLLVVNSIRTLVLNSGPSQLPAASISTPSQIAKNLITNASFRAKKIGDDIPKVENDTLAAAENNPIADNIKKLANMTSISEDAVLEDIVQDKTPSKKESTSSVPGLGGGLHVNKIMISKDKLRPKIPGFKKRSQDSESERSFSKSFSGTGSSSGAVGEGVGGQLGNSSSASSKKTDKRKESNGGNNGSGGHSMSNNADSSENVKISSKSDRKKEKASKADSLGSIKQQQQQPSSATPSNSSFFNGLQSLSSSSSQVSRHQQLQQDEGLTPQKQQHMAPSDIESMDQIEALIQRKKLPNETITIHSPESGTTLF